MRAVSTSFDSGRDRPRQAFHFEREATALMKDVVLLAVSVYLLKQDVVRAVDSQDVGAAYAEDRRAVEAVP